jgi:putative endonuclease
MEKNSTDKGRHAEDMAAEYLINKGYVVLERNWRYKHYEIDIIAENNDVLVVVEVKFRSYNTYGEPEVFVNKQKQKYLTEAINAYIQQKNIDKEVRFDIVSVGFKNKSLQVHHIEDAFYAG